MLVCTLYDIVYVCMYMVYTQMYTRIYIHRSIHGISQYIQGYTMYRQIKYMCILISCKLQQGFVEEMQNGVPAMDSLLQRPLQMRMGAVPVLRMLNILMEGPTKKKQRRPSVGSSLAGTEILRSL